jgi:cysteinyl-tRNA synthetase
MLDESGPAVAGSREGLDAVWSALALFDQILGLFRDGLPRAAEEVPSEILSWLDERNKAKSNKDFHRADELRNRIQEAGYVILDTHSGSTIRKK